MSTQKNITERKRLLIFLNIVISCIASSMLSTALTAALPAIVADLKISVTTGQWLTSGYSLAMGVMMPLTAFLITRFPTRRLYLAGLLLSISGLVVCVIAPNFSVMMLARILQAGGNGILTAMSQVLIGYGLVRPFRGSRAGHCADAGGHNRGLLQLAGYFCFVSCRYGCGSGLGACRI